MTFEPTRRQVLRGTFGVLAASCATGLGHSAAAASSRRKSRSEYQARYRELFKACGKDLDQKMVVGHQLLDNYDQDALAYRVPDRAAVARMHAALVRQHRARRVSARVSARPL
ncbi:hypothetical protein [Streptomyces sp. NPDC057966]|uniref:hypothetical protein n=1 Tax=Streptomyces sp. NPDC057966 TaxID=3346292 RepID=UPI0036F09A6E